MKVIKTISIDKAVSDKIENLRKKEERSYSSQISFMLKEYLERVDRNEKRKQNKEKKK